MLYLDGITIPSMNQRVFEFVIIPITKYVQFVNFLTINRFTLLTPPLFLCSSKIETIALNNCILST